MIVFGMQDEGAIASVVRGEKIGTYVGDATEPADDRQ